jgi:hypothetical protein
MTDTPRDIDEHHVVYNGQLYRRIAVKPYIRADRSATRLAYSASAVASMLGR